MMVWLKDAAVPVRCSCSSVLVLRIRWTQSALLRWLGPCRQGPNHRNNALCVHLILNTSTELQLHLTGTAASFNQTIIQPPPPQ